MAVNSKNSSNSNSSTNSWSKRKYVVWWLVGISLYKLFCGNWWNNEKRSGCIVKLFKFIIVVAVLYWFVSSFWGNHSSKLTWSIAPSKQEEKLSWWNLSIIDQSWKKILLYDGTLRKFEIPSKFLNTYYDEVRFDNVKDISNDMLYELINLWVDEISLNWLTSLDESQAKILAKFLGKKISLTGLESISTDAAAALKEFNWTIYISNDLHNDNKF